VTTLVAPAHAPDVVIAGGTISVPMGHLAVAGEGTMLRAVGLGSCVAIVLLAPQQRLAAMAHCMLPHRESDDAVSPKFASCAVPALRALLADTGATLPLAAVLVGGASMFPGMPAAMVRDIAGHNVAAARAALADAGIPIRVEDVGGQVGRSVLVSPFTQRVMVRTIRGGDRWL
jgi:chemotaxis protein CheD